MSKMNVKVMELLLKKLASNVGYDLIAAPFDTPFKQESIKTLPAGNQIFWTMPTSVLASQEYEDFRSLCVNSDIIDTVCTTSLSWPMEDSDNVAILMIDIRRRRRGCIKLVDASSWDITDKTDMAAVCNMLIHDIFPGEKLLAFQMNEDAMDEDLDNRWNDQVRLLSAREFDGSLLPRHYMPMPVAQKGFKYVRLDELFRIDDLKGARTVANMQSSLDHDFILHGHHIELKVPAVIVPARGDLQPLKMVPGDAPLMIDLTDKIVMIPHSFGPQIDLDYAVEQLGRESTLRQLPFLPFPDGCLCEEDLLGVLIEVPESLKKEVVL